MLVSKYVCLFMLYSCLGWIYETIFCTIKSGKWENRGFLYGPICPIYGTGALLIIVIPQLITTLGILVKNLPTYYNNVRNWICGFIDSSSDLGAKIVEFLDGGYDKLINWMQEE